MESDGVENQQVPDVAQTPEESTIVLKLDRKNTRSEGQKESLARAQAIRREKIAKRKEAEAAKAAEAAEAAKAVELEKVMQVETVDAEPAKDYRMLYKIQKQSLAELMFEKRVNEKIIETLKEKKEETERSESKKQQPVKPAFPAVSDGWSSVGMPLVKKNLMRHW